MAFQLIFGSLLSFPHFLFLFGSFLFLLSILFFYLSLFFFLLHSKNFVLSLLFHGLLFHPLLFVQFLAALLDVDVKGTIANQGFIQEEKHLEPALISKYEFSEVPAIGVLHFTLHQLFADKFLAEDSTVMFFLVVVVGNTLVKEVLSGNGLLRTGDHESEVHRIEILALVATMCIS